MAAIASKAAGVTEMRIKLGTLGRLDALAQLGADSKGLGCRDGGDKLEGLGFRDPSNCCCPAKLRIRFLLLSVDTGRPPSSFLIAALGFCGSRGGVPDLRRPFLFDPWRPHRLGRGFEGLSTPFAQYAAIVRVAMGGRTQLTGASFAAAQRGPQF